MTVEQRFWAKVDKRSAEECWPWKAGKNLQGYGKIRLGGVGSSIVAAHRFAWEITHGPVPAGLCVCHRCDNRVCVNPNHLFIGTQAENMADCAAKDRHTRGERNGMAKLTPIEVLTIRALKGGETQARIATQFGVSQSLIGLIHRGVSWRHI